MPSVLQKSSQENAAAGMPEDASQRGWLALLRREWLPGRARPQWVGSESALSRRNAERVAEIVTRERGRRHARGCIATRMAGSAEARMASGAHRAGGRRAAAFDQCADRGDGAAEP